MPEPVRIAVRALGLLLLVVGLACAVLRLITRPKGKGPRTIDLGRFRRS